MIPIKKVLIICYYWPPAGGPGVQRWLKFAKYLPSYNIQPIMYVPDNPTYPIVDEHLLNDISSNTIVLRQPIFEPYQLASVFGRKKSNKISSGIIPDKKQQTLVEKLLLWTRGNLFIPDARIFWVKPSIKFLEKYISENKIDTIITTGPPHSLHLIGLELKNKLNLKWFADFRDPWTSIGYHKELKLSTFAAKKHRLLEHKVLNAADHIIVTSPSTKIEFENLTNKPIEVITNGFDIEVAQKPTTDKLFSMAHIGSLLSQRNPLILWESLSEILVELPDFKKHFQLKLIGTISESVLQTLEKYKLSEFVHNLGYISHQEALQQQIKSQILLLIEINSADTKCIIPGKLFEYMAAERPIIGIGPTGSDFASIIRNSNTGIFVDYTQKEILKSTIIAYFKLFLEGKLVIKSNNVSDYSRQNLTKKLSKLLLKND